MPPSGDAERRGVAKTQSVNHSVGRASLGLPSRTLLQQKEGAGRSICVVSDMSGHILGHPEYSADTVADSFGRDSARVPKQGQYNERAAGDSLECSSNSLHEFRVGITLNLNQ